MIYHVLELYLKNKKRIKQSRLSKSIWVIIYGCLIALIILPIIGLYIDSNIVIIPEILVIAVFLIVSFLIDRNNIINSDNRIKEYETFLNEFKRALNKNRINWSSDNRLDYLISECNIVIDNRNKDRKYLIRCVEIVVLPVAKFILDIIKDNYEILSNADTYVGILIMIMIAVVLLVIIKITAVLVDLLLKTGSIIEMKNLRNTLNDLKHYSKS